MALARIPDGLSAVEAAPLMDAGVTTFMGLRHSGAQAGELVAVLGVGGLGHLGVQFAAKMGFDTVAIARGADKEAFVKKLGARVYIDSEKQDPAAELMKLGGARAILATATSGAAMTAVIGGLGVDGVLEVVGAPADPLQVPAYALISHRRSIAGWASGRPVDSEADDGLRGPDRSALDERALPARTGPRGLRPDDERQGAVPGRADDGGVGRIPDSKAPHRSSETPSPGGTRPPEADPRQ